jgi:hypothetical protein
MTKVTKSRTYDASKELSTPEGATLKGFIDDQLSGDELTFRILRNGISFADNINCVIKDVSLRHGVPQVVGVDKPVDMILVGKVYSQLNGLSAPLHWYYNDKSDLILIANFNGSPSVAIKIRIVILFQ